MTEQTTPLRQRMIDDMKVRNMAALTQAAYVRAVKNFAAFHRRSPDQLGFEVMHYAIGDLFAAKNDDGTLEKRKQEARAAILFIYWRIVLRLNRTEPNLMTS
jgi:hypothetical protein